MSRSSLCNAVMTESTEAVERGIGTVTVGPGFGGTLNVPGHCRAKTTSDSVRTKYPSRPHPRLLCTNKEQDLRYPFRLVKNWYVGIPWRGAKGHSVKLA